MIWNFYWIFLGLWLGVSAFMDLAVAPHLFLTISSRQEAALLGGTLFLKVNGIEVMASLLLWTLAFMGRRWLKWKKSVLGLLMALSFLVMTYYFYLSPQIIELTEKMDESRHFFHRLYIKLDCLKFVLLFGVGFLSFFKKEESP